MQVPARPFVAVHDPYDPPPAVQVAPDGEMNPLIVIAMTPG
jgi:hypothetical protein